MYSMMYSLQMSLTLLGDPLLHVLLHPLSSDSCTRPLRLLHPLRAPTVYYSCTHCLLLLHPLSTTPAPTVFYSCTSLIPPSPSCFALAACLTAQVLSYSGARSALTAYFGLPSLPSTATLPQAVRVANTHGYTTQGNGLACLGGGGGGGTRGIDGISSTLPHDFTLHFDSVSHKYYIRRERNDEAQPCRKLLAKRPATSAALEFGVVAAITRCARKGVVLGERSAARIASSKAHVNLGDYVQTIAAMQWLQGLLPASGGAGGHVDGRGGGHRSGRDLQIFDRDNGSLALGPHNGSDAAGSRTIVWFNAWWGDAWSHGVPHTSIVPILTGVHASSRFAEQLKTNKDLVSWFRKHGFSCMGSNPSGWSCASYACSLQSPIPAAACLHTALNVDHCSSSRVRKDPWARGTSAH